MGGRREERLAKISRPPAAAALRNEERRERKITAAERGHTDTRVVGGDGVSSRKAEGEREREREERNGECTQHLRVEKRAFREYRSSPLDELTER